MKVAAWPMVDQDAWAAALAPASPFDRKKGAASHLKASTCRLYENGYGRWLTWLDTQGVLDAEAAPATRASEERVHHFYQALLDDGLGDYAVAGRLQALGKVLGAMDPAADFRWLTRASTNIQRIAKPKKDKARGLPSSEKLWELGCDLMQQAESGGVAPLESALLYRDGLIISFLAQRPVRGANLASMLVDMHLVRGEKGWRVGFCGDEVKNKRALEFLWPTASTDALEIYLEFYRPMLLADADEPPIPNLWVSARGNPLRPQDVYARVTKHTTECLGVAICPHRFRHAAATTVANEEPENILQVALILGHTNPRTSEGFYNVATAVRAGDRHQSAIAKQRRSLGARVLASHAATTLDLFARKDEKG